MNKHHKNQQYIQKIINKGIHLNSDGSLVYDYSLLDYQHSEKKIKIICPEHGIFEQRACNHLNGQGCPKCGIHKKKTTKQFITEAKKVHNNFYDYSLVDYINNHTKVKIICPEHGEFEQLPNSHITFKSGCIKCANKKISKKLVKTVEQFIDEAKSIHKDKYGKPLYYYSLVEYINSYTKVKIICPEHGEFEQLPQNHLNNKQGCPQCALKQTVSKPEKYLRDFINNQLNIETINNSRNILNNNKEIDIFIKNKNIAIEFNGIFTHSLFHKNKGNNYHYNKFNDALSKDIKLYSIFEDSFNNNIDSVKSFVIKKLGVNDKLTIIDEFSRNTIIFDDLKLQTFLLENQLNYQHTNENNVYHCLFNENNEIIKCYIIRENTIIDIVEKNYVVVNDDIKYFTGYNLMIDLFYQSPLEEQFTNLKVKEIIKPQIIRREKFDIENCGYIIYEI